MSDGYLKKRKIPKIKKGDKHISKASKDNKKPYHVYKTKDGHIVHVHIKPDADGAFYAAFYNQNLRGELVKIVNLENENKPDKKRLEAAGHGKSVY